MGFKDSWRSKITPIMNVKCDFGSETCSAARSWLSASCFSSSSSKLKGSGMSWETVTSTILPKISLWRHLDVQSLSRLRRANNKLVTRCIHRRNWQPNELVFYNEPFQQFVPLDAFVRIVSDSCAAVQWNKSWCKHCKNKACNPHNRKD